MVAQLLRLRLRLLANTFRRSVWQIVGIVIGLVYGLGLAMILFAGLVGLRLAPDEELIRDVFTVVGSAVTLGFLIVPLFVGVDDAMDPRRFALFGMPERTLTVGLAVSALIGIPPLVLAITLVGTIVTWSRGPGEVLIAVVAAALTLATCVLLSRVSAAVASFVLSTRRAREFSGMLGLVGIILLAPLILFLVTFDWTHGAVRLLENVAGVLGWTPLGAMWAVPGEAASGAWGIAFAKLVLAVATLGALWLVWQALVKRMLVTPGREVAAKQYTGLGWFDRLPHNPTGVIAARSFTYWARDARYWTSVIIIPIIPVLVMVPLGLAGVDSNALVLLLVPIMSVFIGWALHNDVAYDHTAVWLHIASGEHGIADRLGRVFPVLIGGTLVVVLGSAISVFLYGDWSMFPAVVGVSVCLLFGGLGVGSYTSARFPYPAVKPGDSPFQQPQSSGTLAALVQSLSLLVSIVITIPALVFSLLALFDDSEWALAALAAGAGLGLAVLVGGVLWGGRVFNRRAPEILAAAQRA